MLRIVLSDKKPTEPGFYLCKEEGHRHPELVEVWRDERGQLLFWDGPYYDYRAVAGVTRTWSERIELA